MGAQSLAESLKRKRKTNNESSYPNGHILSAPVHAPATAKKSSGRVDSITLSDLPQHPKDDPNDILDDNSVYYGTWNRQRDNRWIQSDQTTQRRRAMAIVFTTYKDSNDKDKECWEIQGFYTKRFRTIGFPPVNSSAPPTARSQWHKLSVSEGVLG